MLNAGKIILRGLIVYGALPTAYAFAAADAGGNVRLVFSIIGVAVAVGVTVALLVRFIRYLASLKPAPPTDTSPAYAAESLDQSLEKELGDSFLPGAERKIAMRVMKKVLEKEVTKRVVTVAKEMDEKYQATIREKNLEYSDIDKKYKSTLGYKKQTESVMRSIAEGLVVLNDKGEIISLSRFLLIRTHKDEINNPNIGMTFRAVALNEKVLKMLGVEKGKSVYKVGTLTFAFQSDGLKVINFDCKSHKPIKFAHQLQNFVMALIDIELLWDNK